MWQRCHPLFYDTCDNIDHPKALGFLCLMSFRYDPQTVSQAKRLMKQMPFGVAWCLEHCNSASVEMQIDIAEAIIDGRFPTPVEIHET